MEITVTIETVVAIRALAEKIKSGAYDSNNSFQRWDAANDISMIVEELLEGTEAESDQHFFDRTLPLDDVA